MIDTGKPYDLAADDIVGSRDSHRVQGFDITDILAFCSASDRGVEQAMEAMAVLYPALVFKVNDTVGGVVIPVIQN